MGFDLGGWVSNAVKSAGRAVGSALHTVDSVTGAIGNAIKSVPFVGPVLLDAILLPLDPLTMPVDVTIRLSKGQRIDQAVLGHLKEEVREVKEVAPYAQMLITVIPGIGPAASGAISAGLALAEGQPIDKALLAGVEGALPGGPLAKAAFDLGSSALSAGLTHKRFDFATAGASAVSAITDAAGVTLPDAAKKALAAGLGAAQALADGKPADAAILDNALTLVPVSPAVRTAMRSGLMAGLAMAHGQSLQNAVQENFLKHPEALLQIASEGSKAIGLDQVLQSTRNLLPTTSVHGFDVGVGMMHAQVGPSMFVTIRNSLNPLDRKGFDTAVSTHIGRVTTKPAVLLPPLGQVGYYLTNGMRGAKPKQKVVMMSLVAKNLSARKGATVAIKTIAAKKVSLWYRIKRFLGLTTA